MKKYNLIVAGGGLSGVAAAISAAREGLSVLLIEKSGALGGAMTNAFVYPFVPFWTVIPSTKEVKYLNEGLFKEMNERQNLLLGKKKEGVHFDPEYFKFVLDDMILEAGVDVLFHACVCNVTCHDRKVESATVAVKAGLIEVEADFFVDATGDGDIIALAGCDYQMGRESDNLCQPMTMCFRMSGVDIELFHQDRSRLKELYQKYQAEGKLINPREDILTFVGLGDGILHFNTTRVVKHDATNPFELSKAEILARKQICEMVSFLKENSKAFENSVLISIAPDIGIRESRKLKGEYILTVSDLKDCVAFDDTIALGNYCIDIHSPEGAGTVMYFFKPGEYYQIPYRSLLPKEYDNILVAGRCLSATHEALSAVRVMPICCCMGEAAGTAIGIAFNTNTNMHTVDVQTVRSKLKEYGAVID